MADTKPKKRQWRKIVPSAQEGDFTREQVKEMFATIAAMKKAGQVVPSETIDLRELGKNWIERQHREAA